MARCLDAIPEGSNALIGKEPRRIGARLVLEGVLQPDSGFDFLRVSVTLLTLHIPIAAQVVRQIRVVVKTVIKAVLLRGVCCSAFLFLHGAKKEKNADSAVKSNETLWFCKKGCLTRSPKKENPRKTHPEDSNRWCPRLDSNQHALRRCDLNTVRLPISPLGQRGCAV